jgi:hypothetical protein
MPIIIKGIGFSNLVSFLDYCLFFVWAIGAEEHRFLKRCAWN